jgi:hypothetical protein
MVNVLEASNQDIHISREEAYHQNEDRPKRYVGGEILRFPSRGKFLAFSLYPLKRHNYNNH